MAGQNLLTQALSESARTLVQGFAISDVLNDLARQMTAVWHRWRRGDHEREAEPAGIGEIRQPGSPGSYGAVSCGRCCSGVSEASARNSAIM